MKFTRAYSGSDVCAPSRNVLMTGQHTGHVLRRANQSKIGLLALPPGQTTVARLLHEAGYATGGFGKWGLGNPGTTGVAEKQGFDVFFGYYDQKHAHDNYTNYLVRNSANVPYQQSGKPTWEDYSHTRIAAKGFHTRRQHPMEMILQTIQMGQSMHTSMEKGELACYPLLTRSRPVVALWLLIPDMRGQNFANVQLLANQAAVTLERVNLLAELRRQAREIEAPYEELEQTYDQTLKALMSALDARDRETEGHSMRVIRLACLLGEKIGLSDEQLKALERGALLHDIGKIGISDTILHKPGKLTEDEWKIMRPRKAKTVTFRCTG